MKFIKWLIKSFVIAMALLLGVNFIGRYINISIPINVYTIVISTVFRLPGVIVLIIFFLI